MDTFPISRRDFLKWTGAGVVLAAAGSALDGMLVEPFRIQQPAVDLPVPGLLKEFEGYRILHVTDIHLGMPGASRRMRELIEICNKSTADCFIFTGDFVSDRNAIPELSDFFSSLRNPKDGMFAVLGNHDHWTDQSGVRKVLTRHGVEDMTNRGRLLERGGDAVWICGSGDLWEDAVDVKSAVQGAPDGAPRILLAHNPDQAETLVKADHKIALQLSGHTHGGQVKIPFGPAPAIPSVYGQKYISGLARAPHTNVFVSKGVGVAAIPVRFNCLPEVPTLTLRGIPA